MTSRLLNLPPDVFGSNVLILLSIVDVVHLDTAACSFASRLDLKRLLSMAPTFDLRDPRSPFRYNVNLFVWRWFWKRDLTIKGVDAYFLGVEELNQNIRFVASPVTVSFGVALDSGTFAPFTELIEKVDGIRLVGQVNMNEVAAVIPRMTNLTSIVDESANLTENNILQLIHPLMPLKELKLKATFGVKLLSAILPMGPTLRSLSIRTSTLKEEHFQLIAEHCPHLTTFHMDEYPDEPFSHAGVATIARGCHKLQDVKIVALNDFDDLPLLFASHCPDLRKLDFGWIARLTDDTLHALAFNCPQLVEVTAQWDVNSMETVQNAAVLLAQLQKIAVAELNIHRNTLAFALQHARDVTFLSLAGAIFLGKDGWLAVAERCSQLRQLVVIMCEANVADLLVALVRKSPQLESFMLYKNAGFSDSAIEAIAESCPQLRHLECHDDPSQPSQLTDHAVVKLAKGCSKLLRLKGCSGPGITDVSVLALAEHCRHLERADLYHATQVTETALVQLVKRTKIKNVRDFNKSCFGPEILVARHLAVALEVYKLSGNFLVLNNANFRADSLARIQLAAIMKASAAPGLLKVQARLNIKQWQYRVGSRGVDRPLIVLSHLLLAGIAVGVVVSVRLLYKRRHRYWK